MKKLLALSLMTGLFSLQSYGKSPSPISLNMSVYEIFKNFTKTDICESENLPKENFKNEKLALVYDIFHNTTRNTVEAYMKEKGFDDAEIEPAFEDFGELLSFMTKFGMVEVEYRTDGKVLNVVYSYSGAINNVFIEMELKENNYNGELKKFKAGENLDQEFEKNVWSKSGVKNRFVTSAIEEEKIGILGYGELED